MSSPPFKHQILHHSIVDIWAWLINSAERAAAEVASWTLQTHFLDYRVVLGFAMILSASISSASGTILLLRPRVEVGWSIQKNSVSRFPWDPGI